MAITITATMIQIFDSAAGGSSCAGSFLSRCPSRTRSRSAKLMMHYNTSRAPAAGRGMPECDILSAMQKTHGWKRRALLAAGILCLSAGCEYTYRLPVTYLKTRGPLASDIEAVRANVYLL